MKDMNAGLLSVFEHNLMPVKMNSDQSVLSRSSTEGHRTVLGSAHRADG